MDPNSGEFLAATAEGTVFDPCRLLTACRTVAEVAGIIAGSDDRLKRDLISEIWLAIGDVIKTNQAKDRAA